MQKCFKISVLVEYVKIVRVKKCISKPFPGTERQQHKKCFGGLHYRESGERRGRLRDKIVRERERDGHVDEGREEKRVREMQNP